MCIRDSLPAVPLCLEYVKHNHSGMEASKKKGDEKPTLETLLWGDDLGIITKYDFFQTDWHICQYKQYKKQDRDYLVCHREKITNAYYEQQWEHEALRDTLVLKKPLEQMEKEDREREGAAQGVPSTGQDGISAAAKAQNEESKGGKPDNEE